MRAWIRGVPRGHLAVLLLLPFPIMNRLTDLIVPAPAEESAGGPNVANALRGARAMPLSAYADRPPRDAIAAVQGFDAKELELTSFAGEPLYLVTNGRGETRLISLHGGLMTDSFTLTGGGPAHLNNGFVGNFVSDFFNFFTVPDVISSYGDPLNFETGEVHCDPL